MAKIINGTLQNEFQEIDSALNVEDFIIHDVMICRDFKLVFLGDPINEGICWVQVLQESEHGYAYKLIQEIKINLRHGETIQDVIDRYKSIYQ